MGIVRFALKFPYTFYVLAVLILFLGVTTVVQYNASSVPVLQLSLSSDRLNEQKLYDYGLYSLRQQLARVQGVTFPTPDGGKYRQIMVDIDPLKLQAKGLTPADVVNAVSAQNLTLPSGLAKIGDTQSVFTSHQRRPVPLTALGPFGR
jgi:multidrug efflux pump subunit AcrB